MNGTFYREIRQGRHQYCIVTCTSCLILPLRAQTIIPFGPSFEALRSDDKVWNSSVWLQRFKIFKQLYKPVFHMAMTTTDHAAEPPQGTPLTSSRRNYYKETCSENTSYRPTSSLASHAEGPGDEVGYRRFSFHVIGFSDRVGLWVIKIKKLMILCARSASRSREQWQRNADHAARLCQQFVYSVVKITRLYDYQTWKVHFGRN